MGVPETFEEHVKLMFDLQGLAFQAEITRGSTMMYARDLSGAVYPQSGVRDAFHSASHHADLRRSSATAPANSRSSGFNRARKGVIIGEDASSDCASFHYDGCRGGNHADLDPNARPGAVG